MEMVRGDMKKLWLIAIASVLAGCTHQSRVTPSTGHIDANGNAQKNEVVSAPVSIPKPVKSNIYVPPPKAKTKEQTYSVVVNEVPVKEILFALARESKLNVDIHPSIQGRVTLNAVDQTLPAILERLAKQVDLTYKLEGNVLSIGPDLPVLRTYKVDYVNMSRDTSGFIGAAAEIASTGRAATTGTAGSTTAGSSAAGSTGGAATNSSRTSVTSVARNHLWETLVQNIKDLLAETDKEVLISRSAGTNQDQQSRQSDPSAAQSGSNESGSGLAGALAGLRAAQNAANNSGNAASGDDARNAAQAREDARTEFKTLFAATVIASPETGIISVRATSKQHEKVQEFLDKVMASAKKQVLIEATIVEVQLSDNFQSGIDWSRLNNSASNSGFVVDQTLGPSATINATGGATGFAQNALGGNTTAGLVAGYLNPLSAIGNISASITLLKQFGDTKVLSSPKLMVLNNQTAVLKVVNNLVYFTVQSQVSQGVGTGSTNLLSVTTTPNTVPVGMVMSVTPQINDTGEVNINVRPTISRVLSFVRDPNPTLTTIQSQIPQIQVREMESILQVRSGNTAVLGGLMQDEIFRNTDSVPGLNELPLLGRVFNGRNNSTRKTELVIFLRPTVIANASLESDELRTYKQYLPGVQLEQKLNEPVN